MPAELPGSYSGCFSGACVPSDLINSRPKKQFLKQLNVAIFNFLNSGPVQPEWDLVVPLGGPAGVLRSYV